MKTNAVVLLFLCLAGISPLFAGGGSVVNVESFGAVANGSTDNTKAINAAVASLHQGQTLFFPCSAGNAYVVDSPISFGKLNYTHIEGSGPGCFLYYKGSTPQPYAFSLVGAEAVDVRNMDFYGGNSAAPPQAVLLLGRTNASQQSGQFKFNGVRVEGYATKALVYSIASEENTWLETSLDLNGGGALYAFYTSGSDDLGVADLPTASNLSIWMQNFHICDFSSSIDPTHVLIYDNGLSSATGNHTFRDGYLASRNGTGFAFGAEGTSMISWMSLTVDSNRFENGYQMFNFTGGGAFGDVSLTNNKSAGVSKYLIYMPTACYDCNFEGNVVQQGDGATTVFGTLLNSSVSENYSFTVQHVISSNVFNRSAGTLQLSSSLSGAACNATTEGTMRYLSGASTGTGVFQICQSRAGSFSWITH